MCPPDYKAGLVRRAEDWPWSSAAAHVKGHGDAVGEGLWLKDRIAGWTCSWRQYLSREDEAELASAMQTLENTGRPLGNVDFVKRIGNLPGRDLTPRKPGRPFKNKQYDVPGTLELWASCDRVSIWRRGANGTAAIPGMLPHGKQFVLRDSIEKQLLMPGNSSIMRSRRGRPPARRPRPGRIGMRIAFFFR